ncbi:hypothetical protein K8R43_00205, partial [archaeon]|nr:hypothetical protein [archaeon]
MASDESLKGHNLSAVYLPPLPKYKKVLGKALAKTRPDDLYPLGFKRTYMVSWSRSSKQKIPIDAVKKACELLSIGFFEIINGELLCSSTGNCLTFKNKVTPKIAYLLGLIATDGHIRSSRPGISVDQNDREMLEKISKLFMNEFGIQGNMRQSHNAYKLEFGSSPLKYILCEIFELPAGVKSYSVRMPPKIRSSNHKIKTAFLAGCIDGDGSISTTNHWKGFSYPRLTFKCGSKNLVTDLTDFLKELDMTFSLTLERNKSFSTKEFTGHHCYGFEVRNRNDFNTIVSELLTFLLTRKKERVIQLVRQPDYIFKCRIEKNETTSEVLKHSAIKLGSYQKLADHINNRIGKKKFSPGMIKQYSCLKTPHRPSLGILFYACDLLGLNVLDIVGEKFAFLISHLLPLPSFSGYQPKSPSPLPYSKQASDKECLLEEDKTSNP